MNKEGAYDSGKPGNLWELVNSGKFRQNWGYHGGRIYKQILLYLMLYFTTLARCQSCCTIQLLGRQHRINTSVSVLLDVNWQQVDHL